MTTKKKIGLKTKTKEQKPFFFKNLTHQQLADLIDKELPILLSNHEELINRIHAKYPILEKSDIAIIIKQTLIEMRRFFTIGDFLSIYTIFNFFKIKLSEVLSSFSKESSISFRETGKVSKSFLVYLKSQLSTSAFLKKDVKEFNDNS